MGNTKSIKQSSTNSNCQSRLDPLADEVIKYNPTKKLSKPRLSMDGEKRKLSMFSPFHRQIIKGCMDKAKDDIAERIYRRIYEKSDEFRAFVDSLTDVQKTDLIDSLYDYVQQMVETITNGSSIQRTSEEFGAKHVQYRSLGFRPDFFALTANAMTTECMLLDSAAHSTSEVLIAWSTLTSLMFSSVRDGYYNEQRRMRRLSQFRMSSTTCPNGDVADCLVLSE